MITAGLGGLAPASLGETPKKGGPGGATPSLPPQVLPQRTALFQGLFQERVVAIVLTPKRPELPEPSTGPQKPTWVAWGNLVRQPCLEGAGSLRLPL